MPFEQQMVRFLDNFSAGTRGATTAEILLRDYPEYHVIFLYRLNAMTPFNRKYTHGKTLPLDLLYQPEKEALDADAIAMFTKEAKALHEVSHLHLFSKSLCQENFKKKNLV